MSNKGVKIMVRPDGVQSGRLDVVPLPFSFERDVLAGGAYSAKAARAICELYVKDLFPNRKKGNLFVWETLTPHIAVSIAASYHAINSAINKDSVVNGEEFKPIKDTEIRKRLSRTGLLTPQQVEVQFSPARLARNSLSVK